MSDFKNLPMKGKHLINLLAVVAALCYSAQSNGVTPNDQTPCKTGPDNNYIQIKLEGKCCDSCRPGTYMVQLCQDKVPSSTRCKECDPGTYTEGSNLAHSCLPQHYCGHNEITVSVGTTMSKAKCACKPGYTRSPEGGCRRVPNWRPTITRIFPTTTRTPHAKTERHVASPHKKTETQPRPTMTEDKQQAVIETKPQGNKSRDNDGEDVDPDGTDDKGKYQVIDDDVKSGSSLDGIYIAIIIVALVCFLGFVAIVAIVATVRRKTSHPTDYRIGNGIMSCCNLYKMASTTTTNNDNYTLRPEEKDDHEGDAQDNLLEKESKPTTCVATEESDGSDSQQNLQPSGGSEAFGLNDTQKEKSSNSINGLVSAVHGPGYLGITTETSQ